MVMLKRRTGKQEIAMDDERRIPPAIARMVARSSDEHLEAIVGPDRHFYDGPALEAAEDELRARRERASSMPHLSTETNLAAFFLGPLWYAYHGLTGRALLLSALYLGALLALVPLLEDLGLPELAAVGTVLLLLGGYSGRNAARDLAESAAQDQLQNKSAVPTPTDTERGTNHR
jgi:hypothetical protein